MSADLLGLTVLFARIGCVSIEAQLALVCCPMLLHEYKMSAIKASTPPLRQRAGPGDRDVLVLASPVNNYVVDVGTEPTHSLAILNCTPNRDVHWVGSTGVRGTNR